MFKGMDGFHFLLLLSEAVGHIKYDAGELKTLSYVYIASAWN